MFVGSYRNVYAPGGFSFGGWADNGASSVDGFGNCYGNCLGVFTQNPDVKLGSWSQLYDLYVNGESAIVEEPGPTGPSVDNNNAVALGQAINATRVQALQHPCLWASVEKDALIASGGGGAAKTALKEGIGELSWGQKVLGSIAAYQAVTARMGRFYDELVKPITNAYDDAVNGVCNAIGTGP